MDDRKPRQADRKPKRAKTSRLWYRSPAFKVLLALFIFSLIASSGITLYYYNYYSKIIDRRLDGEVFKRTARIYSTPFHVFPGQKVTADAVLARLQRAGFETPDKADLAEGTYEVASNKITIRPKGGEAMRLDFARNSLIRIVKLPGGETPDAWLPAELVTNLFDESRQKRRIVEFAELPNVLVDALVASEDQRFFSHWGLDPIRLTGAVIASIRKQERVEGTSTITQQLARNFFLTLDRRWSRKLAEALISLMLEQRLTKEQIITLYANEVYLGYRGSFSINGFGEGAAAFFGKDLGQLTLSEAATLVGVIPSPNAYEPSRHPERAKARRDTVMAAMVSTGAITTEQFEEAKAADVIVAPLKVDSTDAPYLVDFIRQELLKDYSEEQLINDSLRVYTTLDPDLQRAAVDAVDKGLKFVQEQIAARDKGKRNPEKRTPQAAIIAIDPHTGEIKAMVGGGDYGASQYNRITRAFRQPGSIFKPFVYAAAFESAFDTNAPVEGEPAAGLAAEPAAEPTAAAADNPAATNEADSPVVASDVPAAPEDLLNRPIYREGYITPITTFIDEPTTFVYEGMPEPYEPNNYKEQYRGLVTARTALQHSLNVPAIKVAERIGYERVANFAKRAGLNANIKGYPSIALGAFEVTPLEMAGAYTIFANEGRRMQPHSLLRVAPGDGSDASDASKDKVYKVEPEEVIRPELAYLMTHLLQGVINEGTGVRVRALGFNLPAAGKTGTSRDGWFAGYTKDLLAIAWVGFDDNSDLNLEGSRSALPIWTEFMLKATQLYPSPDPDAVYFTPPPGIEIARIDAESLLLANPNCENTFDEAFIAGTVPGSYCPLHGFRLSSAIKED